MEYIESEEPKYPRDELFLRLGEQPISPESLILYFSEYSYIIMNRYPYNAGHLLVVPKRPAKKLGELTAEERVDFMDLLARSEALLEEALSPQGINIGLNMGSAAGAGVPNHLHAHIVPRWNGDSNFMPVIGETKVLPASLEAMWHRLKEFI